jgi:transposase
MPPQYIKAYVKRGKNDAIDAEAICEAMSRPTMRFVPVKTAEQQAALVLGLDPRMLGVRDLLVKQRTMLINALRGHAAAFGVTVAKEPALAKAGDPSRWLSCCGGWRATKGCRHWRARCSASWRANSMR